MLPGLTNFSKTGLLSPPSSTMEGFPNPLDESNEESRPFALSTAFPSLFGDLIEDQTMKGLVEAGLVNPQGILNATKIQNVVFLQLTTETLQNLKKLICDPIEIKGLLTKEMKAAITQHATSKAFKEQYPHLTDKKIETFLRNPIFKGDDNTTMAHTLTIGPYVLRLLQKSKQTKIYLNGGKSRQLLLPWFRLMLERNLKKDLKFSEYLQGLLGQNPPDIDFILHCPSFSEEDLLLFDQTMVIELCEAFLGPFVKELLPLYELLIRTAFCKINSSFTANQSVHSFTIGKECCKIIDIVTTNKTHLQKMFEFNMQQIEIPVDTIARWIKQQQTTITELDYAQVTVVFNKEANESRIQAIFDIMFGFLHNPMPELENEKAWPRYLSWINRLYRGPVQGLKQHFFQKMLATCASRVNPRAANYFEFLSAEVIKLFLGCHESHNKGDKLLLKAMAVQGLLFLKAEALSNEAASKLIPHFWEQLKSQAPHLLQGPQETIFDLLLRLLNENVEHLNLIEPLIETLAFVKGNGTQTQSNLKINLTLHDGAPSLQVSEGPAMIVKLNILSSLSELEKLFSGNQDAERFDQICNHFLASCSISYSNQIKKNQESLNLNWNAIENRALVFLKSPEKVLNQIGYALLLACRASHPHPGQIQELLYHFPKALNQIKGKDAVQNLLQNFQQAFENTPHQVCIAAAIARQKINQESFTNEFSALESLSHCASLEISRLLVPIWIDCFEKCGKEQSLKLAVPAVQAFLPHQPSASLKVFCALKEKDLIIEDRIKPLFESILNACHAVKDSLHILTEIPLLQTQAAEVISQTVSNGAAIKRKGHHKKNAQPVYSWNCALSFTWMITKAFEIHPDEEAVKLLCNAIKCKIIPANETASLIAKCLKATVNHPKKAVATVTKLWKEALLLKIDKELETEESEEENLREICEGLNSFSEPEAVPVFESLFRALCQNARHPLSLTFASKVAVERLKKSIQEKDTDKALAQIALFQPVLPKDALVVGFEALFNHELEAKNLSKAVSILKSLSNAVPLDYSYKDKLVDACLRHLKDSRKEDSKKPHRMTILEAVEFCLIDVSKGSLLNRPHDEIKRLALLLNFLLVEYGSPGLELPKTFKETVKALFDKLVILFAKTNFSSEICEFFSLAHERQCLPVLSDETAEIALRSCQTVLADLSSSLKHLEKAGQIVTSMPVFNLIFVSLEEEGKVYANFAKRFLNFPEAQKQAFEWILKTLDFMALNNLNAFTAADVISFIESYRSDPYLDPRVLLERALCCPALLGSKAISRAFLILIGEPGLNKRSAEILIEQKHHLLHCDALILQRKAKEIAEDLLQGSNENNYSLSLQILILYRIDDLNLYDRVFEKIRTNASALKKELWQVIQAAGVLDERYPPRCKEFVVAVTSEILFQMDSKDLYEILQHHQSIILNTIHPHTLLFMLLPGSWRAVLKNRKNEALAAGAAELFEIRKKYLERLKTNPEQMKKTDVLLLKYFIQTDHPDVLSIAKNLALSIIEEYAEDKAYLLSLILELLKVAEVCKNADDLVLALSQKISLYLTAACDVTPILSALLHHNDGRILREASSIVNGYLNQQPPENKERASRLIKEVIIQNLVLNDPSCTESALSVLKHPRLELWILPHHYAQSWGMYLRMLLNTTLQFPDISEKENAVNVFKNSHILIKSDPESMEACASLAIDNLIQILLDKASIKTLKRPPCLEEIVRIFPSFINSLMQLMNSLTGLSNAEGPAGEGFGKTLVDKLQNSSQESSPYDSLKTIIQNQLSSDATHEPNLKVLLMFPTKENKSLFFKLATLTLKKLLKSNPDNVELGQVLIYFVQMHLQLLMENYRDRWDELVELIDLFVFTSSPYFQEGHSRISAQFINYVLSTTPLLKSHPEKMYECIVFTYGKGIEFPHLTQKQLLDITLKTIKRIIDPEAPWLIKRSADILGSLPFYVVKEAHDSLKSFYTALINSMRKLPFTQVAIGAQAVAGSQFRNVIPIMSFEYIAHTINTHKALNHPLRSSAMAKTACIVVNYYALSLKELLEERHPGYQHLDLPVKIINFLTSACIEGYIGPHYNELQTVVKALMPLIIRELNADNPLATLKRFELKPFFLADFPISPEHKILRAQMIVEWIKTLVYLNNPIITKYAFEKFLEYTANLKLQDECRPHYSIMQRLFEKVLEKHPIAKN